MHTQNTLFVARSKQWFLLQNMLLTCGFQLRYLCPNSTVCRIALSISVYWFTATWRCWAKLKGPLSISSTSRRRTVREMRWDENFCHIIHWCIYLLAILLFWVSNTCSVARHEFLVFFLASRRPTFLICAQTQIVNPGEKDTHTHTNTLGSHEQQQRIISLSNLDGKRRENMQRKTWKNE